MSIPVPAGKESGHYLVIGVGLISLPKANEETAVVATKIQALGVSVSDQAGLKVGIGYASGTAVAVPKGAEDVRVNVSQKLGGPLTIETQQEKRGEGQGTK